ncbi:MAG: phosphoribosylformylglycinamidine synthase subunit PurQ [Acidimicrobiales bacterium]|nr:phosphoribosylformylglycinamidine synthase subunit PurQ [Acidimicrobiales bacterium]
MTGVPALVIAGPGTNRDRDLALALAMAGADPSIVLADQLVADPTLLRDARIVAVAGGFSYGDALGAGNMLALDLRVGVGEALAEYVATGRPMIGICNGFQVLTEAGLLPGALQKNRGLKFLCTTVALRVESTASVLTSEATVGDVLRVPINHFEGNYTCAPDTLSALQANDQIVLRYVDNPNGSIDDIAGICSEGRNVVGLMPHPERAISDLLGSADGVPLLRSLLASASAAAAA